MKYPENRITFTVNEVSKACGVSRATLLRMEECGFLKPYRTDPDSGYRYYDADNIMQIGQYLLFMDFGLSRKEATDMYYHWGSEDMKSMLDRQKMRINRLQRLLNEFEMRSEHTNDFSISYVDLPEMTCFCAQIETSRIDELETFAYNAFQNMVKEGFRVRTTESQFVLISESNPNLYTICFPVFASDEADTRVQIFPACHAFSVMAHGDYSVIPVLLKYSREAVSSRHLKVTGTPRIIALVAPYVGEHISPEDYCYQYVFPIEREN